MRLSELCGLLHGELVGDGDIEIKNVARIENATANDLTFVANPKYLKYLDSTKASAVLVSRSVENVKISHIKVDDPYLAFKKSLKIIYPPKQPPFKSIHSLASIDDSAIIAEDVKIGPFVYIGPKVEINSGTVIYPGTVVEAEVKIGKNCILCNNVSIYHQCEIGDNVIVHSGVVIGSDGFGFAHTDDIYEKIPQIGKVIIEDDVELGANCTIDRATVGETRIKKGCKLDNLVQVAHNVVIGENTVIAAQSGIAGSTKIGKHVTIAGQVGIVGHIEIGDDAILAAQSGISKNVPKGEVVFGSPAIPLKKQKKIEAVQRHLPEMNKKLHQLEKIIIELEEKIKKLDLNNE